MRPFNFVSVKLALGLILGITIGFYWEIHAISASIGLIVLLIALFLLKDKRSDNRIPVVEMIVLFSVLFLGILVITLAKKPPNHYSKANLEAKHTWHLKVLETLNSNSYSQSYVVRPMTLDASKSAGKLLLYVNVDSTITGFSVDDEILVHTVAKSIPSPLNPHQFNYQDYIKKQGILHQIRIDKNAIIKVENASKTLSGLAHRTRNQLIEKLGAYDFGTEELGVIQALLLGHRKDISENTYTNYKNAGAVHILAVSGLHVGILLLLLEFLLAPLKRLPKGRLIHFIVILLLLWSYAFVAGLSPSIIRAVTMFSFFAYAFYLNRPTNSFNIIALSLFFILLINPFLLFQVGFQMSYAAVIAIVWLYPKLQKFWYPDSWLVRKIWQLLAVSVSAQLGVLPISLYYFHQFPSLFFVSNLLIVPFLGLILGMGILVLLLAIFNQQPDVLVQLYNAIIGLMNSIVAWVAHQEGFVLKDIPFDGFQMMMAYVVIISTVFVLSQPKLKRILVLCIGIMGLQVHAIWNQWQHKHEERLLLLHKSRNTVIFQQQGDGLQVLAQDTSNLNQLVKNYKVSERIKSIAIIPLKQHYTVREKKLYIMDSLGIYPNNVGLDYLLLTQSPKVNLERLLDSIRPKIVLAHGSNYKSYIARWKKTCDKKEIPFHATGEKGAFYFK